MSRLSEELTKVIFSNLDKILYPKSKITKRLVVEYYIKVAPRLLDLLAERAIVTTRYPDGIEAEGFYEKDPNDPFVLYGIALEYMSENQYQEADSFFRKLLEQNPDYVAGYLKYAQLKEKENKIA